MSACLFSNIGMYVISVANHSRFSWNYFDLLSIWMTYESCQLCFSSCLYCMARRLTLDITCKLFNHFFFIIHMSDVWIYVMSLFGQPVGWPSCVAKTLSLEIICKVSTKFVHTCHAYRHLWLRPFYITFTDCGFGWGSQGQCKAEPLDFISSHTFQLMGWNLIWCWSNLSWTSWDYIWVIFIKTREITAVLLTANKPVALACICMYMN